MQQQQQQILRCYDSETYHAYIILLEENMSGSTRTLFRYTHCVYLNNVLVDVTRGSGVVLDCIDS